MNISSLKHFLLIIIVFISLKTFGQNINPTTTELQKHDLNWLKSKNDFDQTKFTEAQINSEISNLINQQVYDETLTKDLEIPLNSKLLKYVGFKHPNDLGIFNANKINDQNSASINKKLHIYRYGLFYFSTETDDATSQQNIYYAIRALNILQTRYHQAYQKLFIETNTFQTEKPSLANFSNSNKAFWIAFNEIPTGIASSYTSFIGDGYFPKIDSTQIGKFRNIPIINIHSKKILGEMLMQGSRPIYQKTIPKENYSLYMREGLLETFVHEMLHRYIDYAYTFDKRVLAIFNHRNIPNFQPADECATMNTSLPYFIKAGGFTENIFNYYYSTVFYPNIDILKSHNFYDEYGKIFTDVTTNKKPREILKLTVLD